jgi:hypothetical protein
MKQTTDSPELEAVMQLTYRTQYDVQKGLWQIVSRSGHIVYESSDGDYVRAVCHELSGWSPAPRLPRPSFLEQSPATACMA